MSFKLKYFSLIIIIASALAQESWEDSLGEQVYTMEILYVPCLVIGA